MRLGGGTREGAEGRALTIGIRPEHVVLTPDGVPMQVDLMEPLGSETLVHGRLPGETPLTVRVSGPPPRAESLAVAFPSEHLHVFDGESGRRLDPR